MILIKTERQVLLLYEGSQPNGIEIGRWTEASKKDHPMIGIFPFNL